MGILSKQDDDGELVLKCLMCVKISIPVGVAWEQLEPLPDVRPAPYNRLSSFRYLEAAAGDMISSSLGVADGDVVSSRVVNA